MGALYHTKSRCNTLCLTFCVSVLLCCSTAFSLWRGIFYLVFSPILAILAHFDFSFCNSADSDTNNTALRRTINSAALSFYMIPSLLYTPSQTAIKWKSSRGKLKGRTLTGAVWPGCSQLLRSVLGAGLPRRFDQLNIPYRSLPL